MKSYLSKGQCVLPLLVVIFALGRVSDAQQAQDSVGIDESTPSRSQYFSWINNTNEGATQQHTLTNLAFFAWLKQEYGMQLDVYALDAGAIDGKRWYGNMQSERFKQQFPDGFDAIYQAAKKLDTRLGIWGGPDGFGETEKEQDTRQQMWISLCRDYHFSVFKFDSVAGQLRSEKQRAFADMMASCRQYTPDLVLLNHRLNLGEIGRPHATTFLWEGKETYIDVHLWNTEPAPHHRAGALSRGLPPDLSRLTEDHGVCLSSSLDYWDDELVLQAFNRALILSPQIYCNPWLLRDNEFPTLARIFNLARQHRQLLTKGVVLPKEHYGPHAVSRGDGDTRLITLRNLTWTPITYTLTINQVLGLEARAKNQPFQLMRYHPTERHLGAYRYGDEVNVVVEPFRSALFKVSREQEVGLSGVNYKVIEVQNDSMTLELQGKAGSQHNVTLIGGTQYREAILDGKPKAKILSGSAIHVTFDGVKHSSSPNRFLGVLKPASVPDDAETYYEATVFSADNNALEVRSLARSGPSQIEAVKAARQAFFEQPLFVQRGIWDKNLFDDDHQTAFYKMRRWEYTWNAYPDPAIENGAFRLDFGNVIELDEIVLHSELGSRMQPLKLAEGLVAQVSSDLKHWTDVSLLAGPEMHIRMPTPSFPVRYIKLVEAPNWLSEVKAYQAGKSIPLEQARASNLFADFEEMSFQHAWQKQLTLKTIPPNAYLSVAIAGEYGNEGVYAGLKIDGKYVGAPDRAPAYPANTWELQVVRAKGDYTYYFPLHKEWENKPMELVVLGRSNVDAQGKKLEPQVWLNSLPVAESSKTLQLSK